MKKLFSLADLPKTIPLFPLGGALLLPHSRLPLHIFEPRYLAMLDDVMKSQNRLIGMIQPMAVPENKAAERLYQIGCAGRLTAFSETDDGRYMITLGGVCRFRLQAQVDGFTPYTRGDVDWFDFERDLTAVPPDHEFDRPRFLRVLKEYFEATDLSSDWESLKEADEELLVNSLAMLCPFDTEEKQALLEAPCLKTRRETLTTLMQFALQHGGAQEGRLQ